MHAYFQYMNFIFSRIWNHTQFIWNQLQLQSDATIFLQMANSCDYKVLQNCVKISCNKNPGTTATNARCGWSSLSATKKLQTNHNVVTNKLEIFSKSRCNQQFLCRILFDTWTTILIINGWRLKLKQHITFKQKLKKESNYQNCSLLFEQTKPTNRQNNMRACAVCACVAKLNHWMFQEQMKGKLEKPECRSWNQSQTDTYAVKGTTCTE